MEESAEIKLVIISDHLRNLIDGISCCFKQNLSIGDSDSYWIVDLKVKERLTEHLKKDTKYRRVTIGVNA